MLKLRSNSSWIRHSFFSGLILVAWVGLWSWASKQNWWNSTLFPSPAAVADVLFEEVKSGRLRSDLLASVFRFGVAYLGAWMLGIPVGLALAQAPTPGRFAFPYLNFLRNLSTLAWIPFAVVWWGIGDAPVIFLVGIGVLFPAILVTWTATLGVPETYRQIAKDYQITGPAFAIRVLFPAILPQLLIAARMTAGIGWVILVAAEMLAGREGLGYAIQDARNGMRNDLLVLNMVLIGVLGVGLDWLFRCLSDSQRVRWGRER